MHILIDISAKAGFEHVEYFGGMKYDIAGYCLFYGDDRQDRWYYCMALTQNWDGLKVPAMSLQGLSEAWTDKEVKLYMLKKC